MENTKTAEGLRITSVVTINRPVEELYQFWRNLENLPRIVNYLESVQVNGEQAHWRAKLPTGAAAEWDTRLVQDLPNELIGWQSVEGAALNNTGSVRFNTAPKGLGTEVRLDLLVDPPGGVVGDTAAKLLGAAPDLMAAKALHFFKCLMETGEIPTTEHQPTARDNQQDNQ